MKLHRSLAIGVLAALAVPAAASAHPGIFTVTQRTYPSGGACSISSTAVTPESCLGTATQYAVGNDGWALSFTEGNSVPAGHGMLNYKAMPGTWRGTDREKMRTYAPAQSDLQAHAICLGTALDDGANIRAWQGDPFFNYVPWQKTSAGLGDDPTKWLPVVKTVTGVDLSTLTTEAQFTQACTDKGGTYYKPDVSSSITTAMVTAAVTAATTPLNTQISTLQSQVDQLTNQVTVLEAAKAAAETAQAHANTLATTRGGETTAAQGALVTAQKAATDAEAGRQALINRPLELSLSARRFSQGAALITGKAGTVVTITMKISKESARDHKLSQTIVSKKVTLNPQGAALALLKVTGKPAREIREHGHPENVTITATGGGATDSETGVLKL